MLICSGIKQVTIFLTELMNHSLCESLKNIDSFRNETSDHVHGWVINSFTKYFIQKVASL